MKREKCIVNNVEWKIRMIISHATVIWRKRNALVISIHRYLVNKGYNIQNSKLCFRDMKIMSLRNGGDFGKQLVLRTRCLPNHHHSFVT